MMSRSLCVLALAAGLAGCGGSSISKPGPTSPHNGMVVELPDSKGFVELLREAVPGKSGQAQIVVYLLDAERKQVTPGPTAATFKGRATNDQPIAFEPTPASDPAKSGGLVSAPIPDRGEIEGELTLTIAGAPTTVPIQVR